MREASQRVKEIGGEGESTGEKAREAYLMALYRYNSVNLKDLPYPASDLKIVEKAFGNCIALLEGKNDLLLQDFFYGGRFINKQAEDDRKTQLVMLVHDLENAVFEAGKAVDRTPQFGAFLERQRAVEEILSALRLLLE